MSPDRHALLATLIKSTRSTLHRLAAEGGVPIEDLMQGVLARAVPRSPVYEKALGEVVAKVPPDVVEAVRAALAETWPQPTQAPVTVIGCSEERPCLPCYLDNGACLGEVDKLAKASESDEVTAQHFDNGSLPSLTVSIAAALAPVLPVLDAIGRESIPTS